jgi:uncharacterized protein (TIGR00296 family)
VEITVLTPPEPIGAETPEERLNEIEIGKHGLIIERGPHGGLLLPQVPVEQGWGKEEFLEGLCMKAGLPRDSWRDMKTMLSSFQGVIFSEKEPGGTVEKR